MGDEQAVIRKKITEADQRLADADELIQDMDDRAAATAEQLSSLASVADEARMNTVRIEERHGTLREAGREAADLAATTIANLKVDLSSAETAVINARHDAGLATATAAAVQAEAERLRIEVAALRRDLSLVRSDKAEVMAQLAVAGAQAKATADELDRERQAGAGAVLKIAETSERAARAEQRATSLKTAGSKPTRRSGCWRSRPENSNARSRILGGARPRVNGRSPERFLFGAANRPVETPRTSAAG
jgi:chromosome segregation ATPase